MKTKKYVIVGNKAIKLAVTNGSIALPGQHKVTPKVLNINNDEYLVNINNNHFRGEVIKLKQNVCTVMIHDNTYEFRIETEKSYKRFNKLKSSIKNANIQMLAPLPGKICDLFVDVKQKVKKGDALFILEAMKMQNEITSPISGTILCVNFLINDNVMKNQFLIEIEADK